MYHCSIYHGFAGLHQTFVIFTTLDGGSVRGDIARVSRLPNTPHKSRYFCIPLATRDVRRGVSHIKELAKQPRYDIDLDIIVKDNTHINDRVIPGLLKKLEAVVEKRKEEEEEMGARAEPCCKIAVCWCDEKEFM